MSWLTSIALYLIHLLYRWIDALSHLKQSIASSPLPLSAQRKQIPKHLALVLASDNSLSVDSFEQEVLENVEQVAHWCRETGIPKLTVYDRNGVLSSFPNEIRQHLLKEFQTVQEPPSEADSEIEYPLTPPLSDDSDDRQVPSGKEGPNIHVITLDIPGETNPLKRRRSSGRNVLKRRRIQAKEQPPLLTVHLISRKSGKPAIAEFANRLFHGQQQNKREDVQCTVSDLTRTLEGEHGFSSPDLMIVHNLTPSPVPKTLELEGFPPWQMRLTEICYNNPRLSWWNSAFGRVTSPPFPLQEVDFRRALDEFSAAEMRLGK
ncbi:hypothetical protein C8Q75DRAFT_807689 [Abortiporus biennis]|nr:hypothetical protein C8Q75DRAFT_807689 [Abortiporus biennis]